MPIKSTEIVKKIGVMPAVLIAADGSGILTSVHAYKSDHEGDLSIKYIGNVRLGDATQNHLQNSAYPILKNICNLLKINQPPLSFEIRIPGAASSSELDVMINGHSFDLAIALALISATLNIPINQAFCATGQLATVSGEITLVASLPEKLDVAKESKTLTSFIYPDHTSDQSFKTLKPAAYSEYQAATKEASIHLDLFPVKSLTGALESLFDETDLIQAAFAFEFWNISSISPQAGHLSSFQRYFTEDHEIRLWLQLELLLLDHNYTCVNQLIETSASWGIAHKTYPTDFGLALSGLIQSMPKHIRRDLRQFTLLSKNKYIKLIQFAGETDHEDISRLHDALYATDYETDPKEVPVGNKKRENLGLLSFMEEKLSPQTIDDLIYKPWDEARASFRLHKNTAPNYDHFLDTIKRFYVHTERKVWNRSPTIDHELSGPNALEMLHHSFQGEQRQKEAITIAKTGQNGGMRYILDTIAEDQKKLSRSKYTLSVFTEYIDPSDEKLRLDLIKQMFLLWDRFLPESIKSQPPERFINSYEEIILAWLESQAAFNRTINKL
jgi:hypothetical protein